jgi:type I restriction enzyme S subunit
MNVMSNVVLNAQGTEKVRIGNGERQSQVLEGDVIFNGSSETPEEVGFGSAVPIEISGLYLNSFCFGFRRKDTKSLDPRFFAYLTRSPLGRDIIRPMAQGSTRYNIAKTNLLNGRFPLPPLKEQEAIAEALSDADAAIESLDALIAKKRDVKQATMQQLLTGRTRLPGFTADWKEVHLGDVGSLRGGTGFPLRFQGHKSGEVPFYKVSDMNLSGNEIQMFDSNNWISEGDSRVLGAAPFPKGSIVFAKVGAAVFLERKRILTRSSCIDNNMMAIVPDASCTDVRFLHFALQMVRFGDLVSATALPSINASGVAGISLALPPLKEQEAIAETLTVIDDELGALTEQASKLRMVKQGMMQDLLTGKGRLM